MKGYCYSHYYFIYFTNIYGVPTVCHDLNGDNSSERKKISKIPTIMLTNRNKIMSFCNEYHIDVKQDLGESNIIVVDRF